MGKMKEEFIRLAEERFNMSPLFDAIGFISKDNLTEEKINIEKGSYKTTITVKFNEMGYPVAHYINSTYNPSEKTVKINGLRTEMAAAAKAQDYGRAYELQKQIKEMEANN